MSGWKKVSLGSEVKIKTGFPFKSANYSDNEMDVKLLRGDNIVQGSLRWDDVKRWPKDQVEDLKDYFLEEGDVVLAMDRPWIEAGLKQACISEKDLPCLQVQRTARLIGGVNLVTPYLRYIIASPWFTEYIKRINTGSNVPHISAKQIREFSIPIPSVDEQNDIANLLSALDSKIELNIRINAELEAMAKTIYDYWFVQFDFPISAALAAKMGDPSFEGRPYKSSGGEMVWNEDLKREMPKGWEVKALGSEIEVQRGISYKSSEIKDGGVPMVNLNSFKLDGTYKDSGIKWFSGKFAEKNLIDKGDLLIAATDVTRNADIIGKAILVPDYRKGGVFSMDIAKVIPSANLTSSYLMMLFNTKHYHDYIKYFASGTIVLHLNMDGMKWYKMEVPPKELLNRFEAFYQPIAQRITETSKQNQELASLRDWLLPMLMNGQVKVGDVKGYEESGEVRVAAEEAENYNQKK